MKILLTGGAGFIGSHLVDRLLAERHQVVVVDDLSSGKLENLNPAVRFYQLDIRSPELKKVFEVEQPSVVNHHAAQIDVRRSLADPIYDARVNVEGTINLLECCREYGVKKVIFASSGGTVYGEPEYLPVDEDHPINPVSPYGLTKYVAEKYISIYQQLYGIEYVALRYANVYGPRQDPHGEAGVVAIFIGKILKGENPLIFGSGEQIRDYVYVGDVVDANLCAMKASVSTSSNGEWRVVNIGTGVGTSVNELFRMIADCLECSVEPIYVSPREGELARTFLDISKSYLSLGWRPRISLGDGLDKTITYFKDVGAKKRRVKVSKEHLRV